MQEPYRLVDIVSRLVRMFALNVAVKRQHFLSFPRYNLGSDIERTQTSRIRVFWPLAAIDVNMGSYFRAAVLRGTVLGLNRGE